MKTQKMNDAQFQIFVKEVKSEMKTDAWLRSNGVNPKGFERNCVEVQKAQMVAKNLLMHHSHLMTEKQISMTQEFLKKSNSQSIKNMTSTKCKRIINIGSAVDRKLFSIRRMLQRNK